ncbi:MAG: hypothetical protein ACP5HQ_08115 [Thermoprotei archaeon]
MISCGRPTAIEGVLLAIEATSADLCNAPSQRDVERLGAMAREGGLSVVYLRVIEEEMVSVYYDESKDAVVVEAGPKSMKLLDRLKVLRKDLNVLMDGNTIVLTESEGGLREVSLPLTPNSNTIALELLEKLGENVSLTVGLSSAGFSLSLREEDGRLTVNVSLASADQVSLERSIVKLPSLLRALEEVTGLRLLSS